MQKNLIIAIAIILASVTILFGISSCVCEDTRLEEYNAYVAEAKYILITDIGTYYIREYTIDQNNNIIVEDHVLVGDTFNAFLPNYKKMILSSGKWAIREK